MICDEAAEYVSALCDGEMIPPVAAKHIGACENCRARLRDYLAMGVELRRVASLETVASVGPRTWERRQGTLAEWWQKGWGTMRIPRLAFAMLIGGVIALASTLAVVKVRAHDTGTVVLLTVATGSNNKPVECALSAVDKREAVCTFLGNVDRQMLGYKIDLLSRDGDRVQLGIRSRVWPIVPGSTVAHSTSDVDREQQRLFSFEPGDTLQVDVSGIPPLIIRGNWLDHMPAFVGTNSLDPGPEELRVISPLLLSDKEILGDLEGGMATEDKRDRAVLLYYPQQGTYLLSLAPLRGGVQAQVNLNRISFNENGRKYELITATPIARSKQVWVLRQPELDPHKMGQSGEYGFIGSRKLTEASPGQWVPADMPN